MTTKNLAAVLLAAGTSSRSGKVNKLLNDWEGKPLILHAIDTLLQAKELELIETIIVVTGHEHDKLADFLSNLDLDLVHNEQYLEGMGTSLATGVSSIQDDYSGIFICLADMPRISIDHYQLLFDNFNSPNNDDIVVPAYEGEFGHPKLFGAEYFTELARCKNDYGAKNILDANLHRIIEVNSSEEILFDVDLI